MNTWNFPKSRLMSLMLTDIITDQHYFLVKRCEILLGFGYNNDF